MVAPPDRIGGRYRLEDEIASHEWGALYKARDERTSREVVAEVLDQNTGRDLVADVRKRARTVAALSHPGIARVLEVGEDGELVFVISEIVTGRSLAELARTGAISSENAVSWCLEVLDALDHAHDAGVVHGDLRASRVIVPSGGRATVTGFADPRVVARAPGGPENDLAQVGALLYQLLGGEMVEDSLPRDLADFLGRWSSPRTLPRPASAEQMRAELRRVRLHAPDEGDPGKPAEREEEDPPTVWPIPGRRYDATLLGRRVIAVAIAIALIALGAFLWRVATRLADDDRPPPPPPTPSDLSSSPQALSTLETMPFVLASRQGPLSHHVRKAVVTDRRGTLKADHGAAGSPPRLPRTVAPHLRREPETSPFEGSN